MTISGAEVAAGRPPINARVPKTPARTSMAAPTTSVDTKLPARRDRGRSGLTSATCAGLDTTSVGSFVEEEASSKADASSPAVP